MKAFFIVCKYVVKFSKSSPKYCDSTLYNIIGQEILSKTLQTGQSTQNIPTTGLESGIYIIKLKADNLILTKKLIIK